MLFNLKRLCLLVMMMMSGFMLITADTVPLSVGYDDTTGTIPDRPRGPVLVPDVNLDSHTLYLYNVGYDLTLVLLDEDDEVAYTAFIPANTASVVLPATLSGDYEMQLYPGGSYYFYGWVEL